MSKNIDKNKVEPVSLAELKEDDLPF